MKRKVSLALVVIIGAACTGMIGYVKSKPAMAQVIAAVATIILASVVVGDRLIDKPELEIKVKDRMEISDGRYSIKVPVLNKGRRDAYNCSVSVQVFNRKSGNVLI